MLRAPYGRVGRDVQAAGERKEQTERSTDFFSFEFARRAAWPPQTLQAGRKINAQRIEQAARNWGAYGMRVSFKSAAKSELGAVLEARLPAGKYWTTREGLLRHGTCLGMKCMT
ncbi:hypothetical protein MRX96_025256 [Rhipicephalus microplus]